MMTDAVVEARDKELKSKPEPKPKKEKPRDKKASEDIAKFAAALAEDMGGGYDPYDRGGGPSTMDEYDW